MQIIFVVNIGVVDGGVVVVPVGKWTPVLWLLSTCPQAGGLAGEECRTLLGLLSGQLGQRLCAEVLAADLPASRFLVRASHVAASTVTVDFRTVPGTFPQTTRRSSQPLIRIPRPSAACFRPEKCLVTERSQPRDLSSSSPTSPHDPPPHSGVVFFEAVNEESSRGLE